MFRQTETFIGGWKDKTIDAMQQRRFEQMVQQLPPLGAGRLENLSCGTFERKLEQCWQDIERKPMRRQQEAEAWKTVIGSIEQQADCLSRDEHDLVERALILGGSAQIEDMPELEAARALSMRLWASIGLVSGKPYIELEAPVVRPAAKAFARQAHEAVRMRFDDFHRYMNSTLYRVGAIDDRQPQQMILRDVLQVDDASETALQLARRYLWSSYDCVDYSDGVLLVHSALADPGSIAIDGRRRKGFALPHELGVLPLAHDILPEEVPLQQGLERTIEGALRSHLHAQNVARAIRFLCKQGAPLDALEEVLQSSLIVYLTGAMRGALADMYYRTPKWITCSVEDALQ